MCLCVHSMAAQPHLVARSERSSFLSLLKCRTRRPTVEERLLHARILPMLRGYRFCILCIPFLSRATVATAADEFSPRHQLRNLLQQRTLLGLEGRRLSRTGDGVAGRTTTFVCP